MVNLIMSHVSTMYRYSKGIYNIFFIKRINILTPLVTSQLAACLYRHLTGNLRN